MRRSFRTFNIPSGTPQPFWPFFVRESRSIWSVKITPRLHLSSCPARYKWFHGWVQRENVAFVSDSLTSGAVVEHLPSTQASHQCGSIPGLGAKWGLSLLLVLVLAPRGFSGTPVFPSSQKPTFPNSNSIWNSRTTDLSVGSYCYVSPSLNKVYLFVLSKWVLINFAVLSKVCIEWLNASIPTIRTIFFWRGDGHLIVNFGARVGRWNGFLVPGGGYLNKPIFRRS